MPAPASGTKRPAAAAPESLEPQLDRQRVLPLDGLADARRRAVDFGTFRHSLPLGWAPPDGEGLSARSVALAMGP